MTIKNTLSTTLLLLMFVTVSSGQSDSWIQFRGNERNSVSRDAQITNSWPAEGPEIIWKKEIGAGYSELLVSDGKAYTMASSYNADSTSGKEFVVAFDDLTGEELWKTVLDSIFIDVDGFGDGPRSTPVLDDKNLFCLSSYGSPSRKLKCSESKWLSY